MNSEFVPQALETPPTTLVSIDLSCYAIVPGFIAVLDAIGRTLDSAGALTPSVVRDLTEFADDISAADMGDLFETAEDLIGIAEDYLEVAGLHGYTEDGWYYIERPEGDTEK